MQCSWLTKNLLLILTLLGVILGVVLGLAFRALEPGPTTILLVSYPGELFIRMLKMIILPLIISSLIVGSSSLNAKANGMLVVRTVIYFLLTSFINAVIGIILVVLIHPGSAITKSELSDVAPMMGNTDANTGIIDGFLDLGRNMLPDNLFQATMQQVRTTYVNESGANGSFIAAAKTQNIEGTNTLGIIVFCLIFGSLLGSVGRQGQVVIDFFTAIDSVVMKLVTGVMWFSPIGVASIILGKILSIDNLTIVISSLGIFVLTAAGGVLLWQIVLQNILYFVLVRKNPVVFFFNLLEPWATGFATGSTSVTFVFIAYIAAALPVSIRCMNEKNKVDPRISKFVLPIGATVNMDGTANFVAVSTVFIAQINDVSYTFGDYATIAVTATATSVATASIPSASLVLIIILLTTMNLPASDISLLFTVDWLLDRIRTTQNILGDCYTAAVVEKWSAKDLQGKDEDQTKNAQQLEEPC